MGKIFKKNSIITLAVLLGVGTIVLTSGVTFAAYLRKTRIDQNIIIADRKGTNIFLDATEWDNDGALFFMYVWNSNNGSIVKKYLRPKGKTIEGYYIYEFQSTVHNKLLFLRANPNYAAINSDAFDDNGDAFVLGIGWNKTPDADFSSISSTPLCKIKSAWSSTTFTGTDGNNLGTVSTVSWSTYSY